MKDRFTAIDGLRGVAILMVTLLHVLTRIPGLHLHIGWLDLTPVIPFGQVGVSLFFALSGFCLFYPIVKNGYQVNWPTFYMRRALRILPPYWIAMLIWGFVAYDTLSTNPLWHTITHLLFLHPFSQDTLHSFTTAFWSLATEEHFYWLFPITALLMYRRPWMMLVVTAIMSVGLSYWAAQTYHAPMFWQVTRLLPARAIEFTCGMLPALLLAKGESRYVNLSWAIGLVGLFLAPLSYLIVKPMAGWWWGNVLFAPCWGCLIYAAVTQPASIPTRILSWKPLVGMGIISYSLYLYQGILDVVPKWIVPHAAKGSVIYVVVSIVGLFAFGILGYYLIEKPFIGLRKRFSPGASTRPAQPRTSDNSSRSARQPCEAGSIPLPWARTRSLHPECRNPRRTPG